MSNLLANITRKLTDINKLGKSLVIGFLALVISFTLHTHAWVQAKIPESALTSIQAGKEYYDLGQFSSAVIALKQALQTYKYSDHKLQEARTLSLLSLAYEQLGMAKLAEKTIDSSLSLLEEIPEILTNERL